MYICDYFTFNSDKPPQTPNSHRVAPKKSKRSANRITLYYNTEDELSAPRHNQMTNLSSTAPGLTVLDWNSGEQEQNDKLTQEEEHVSASASTLATLGID